MEFCMRLASEVIVKEINQKPDKNFVMSPLSLNCLLNMVASGASGRTLEQLLEFLQYDSVDDVNVQSSRMIGLATRNGSKSSWQKLETTILPSESEQNIPDDSSGIEPVKKRRRVGRPAKRIGKSSRQQGPDLSFVGGIWIGGRAGAPMKPSFQQLANDVYKANAKSVDFKSQGEKVMEEVNEWAARETNGLIKDLLPPQCFNTETALVLANALYFKGDWSCPFDASDTRKENFHLLGKTASPVKVPFMKMKTGKRFYASFEGFKVLKLPYRTAAEDKSRFSMYIFLPHDKDGLQEMVEDLTSSQSILMKKDLELRQVQLAQLWIPKFKFSYRFEASDIMKKLGLTLPFEPLGDFTEIFDQCNKDPDFDRLKVTEIFHKAYVAVDEKGTTAAAVSCARKSPGGHRPSPSFVADHPFMFIIKEESSGIILFTGTVVNPLAED